MVCAVLYGNHYGEVWA